MKTVCYKRLTMFFCITALCFSGTVNAIAAGELVVNRPVRESFVNSWLSIDLKDNNGNNLFPDRIKVCTRFVPKAMKWNPQNGSRDWNDPENWTNWDSSTYPNNNGRSTASFTTDLGFVPWGCECTDVLIPGNLNDYPDLTAGSTSLTTNRNINNGCTDGEPACHDIWFEYGGEVARTDLLDYRKANVELTLGANYWYMISPMLQNMYPGDYYRQYANPFKDNLVVYTRLFNQKNPQTQVVGGQTISNIEAGWTGTFNTPDISMPAGFGFGTWLDDDTPATQHKAASIWFPKNDKSYFYYYNEHDSIPSEVQNLDRSNNHRFIYEPVLTAGNVSLSVAPVEKFLYTIVGNPFMSHWKFNEFYADNSSKIKNEYKLLKAGDGSFTTCLMPGAAAAENFIAPMQSILVCNLADIPFSNLTTGAASTVTRPKDVLKSSSSGDSDKLTIIASKDGKERKTFLLFNESASNDYAPEKDSYTLFVGYPTEPIVVYTRSFDGHALDVNQFGDCSQMIPLGIRTSATGNIDLYFEGIEEFLPEYDVFLFDADSRLKINLKETAEYGFEKTAEDLFLDGRLYLSFSKVSDSDLSARQETVFIFTSGNRLQVISSHRDINEVQVFDMQGKMIHRATNIANPVYTHDLESSRIYVVKVSNGQEMIVKKIITAN